MAWTPVRGTSAVGADSPPCCGLGDALGPGAWRAPGAGPSAAPLARLRAPHCPEPAEASCCRWVSGLVQGFSPHLLRTWWSLFLTCVLDGFFFQSLTTLAARVRAGPGSDVSPVPVLLSWAWLTCQFLSCRWWRGSCLWAGVSLGGSKKVTGVTAPRRAGRRLSCAWGHARGQEDSAHCGSASVGRAAAPCPSGWICWRSRQPRGPHVRPFLGPGFLESDEDCAQLGCL